MFQVYELIEQILEVLGGVGGPAGKDYVAVNHVRDSLISPRDRRTKKNLWENAVQFIDQYESRVRFFFFMYLLFTFLTL